MRAAPTGTFNAQTGTFTPIPNQQATATLVYDRTDWEPIMKFGLIILLVGALLGGMGWVINKAFDHADYVRCDKVKLCNDITRAKVQSDITRAGDDVVGFVIPPHKTNPSAAISTPDTPAATTKKSSIRYTGRSCHRNEDPPGRFSGREGYGPGPDGSEVLGCWKI